MEARSYYTQFDLENNSIKIYNSKLIKTNTA